MLASQRLIAQSAWTYCFRPVVYDTPVSFLIYSLPPVLISLISSLYCSKFPPCFLLLQPQLIFWLVLTIRIVSSRLFEFSRVTAVNRHLTRGRYLRLLVLASTDVVITLPWTTFYFALDVKDVVPWGSWRNVHQDFGRFDHYPAELWRSIDEWRIFTELARWAVVLGAFLFFAIFGFSQEARRNYGLAFWKVINLVTLGGRTKRSPFFSCDRFLPPLI